MAFNLLIVDDSNSMRTVVKKIVGLTGLEVNQVLEAAGIPVAKVA